MIMSLLTEFYDTNKAVLSANSKFKGREVTPSVIVKCNKFIIYSQCLKVMYNYNVINEASCQWVTFDADDYNWVKHNISWLPPVSTYDSNRIATRSLFFCSDSFILEDAKNKAILGGSQQKHERKLSKCSRISLRVFITFCWLSMFSLSSRPHSPA